MPENFRTEEPQENIDLSSENNPDIFLSEDYRRSLDAMFQGLERTNELEFSLESKGSIENVKLPQLSRRNFLKAMAVGAAAVLAGGQAEAGPMEDLISARKKLGKEIGKAIIERTGIDMERIAEDNGFFAHTVIDNGKGPYIIHIGQIHESPSDPDTLEEKNKVLKIQKDIEKIVLELQ